VNKPAGETSQGPAATPPAAGARVRPRLRGRPRRRTSATADTSRPPGAPLKAGPLAQPDRAPSGTKSGNGADAAADAAAEVAQADALLTGDSSAETLAEGEPAAGADAAGAEVAAEGLLTEDSSAETLAEAEPAAGAASATAASARAASATAAGAELDVAAEGLLTGDGSADLAAGGRLASEGGLAEIFATAAVELGPGELDASERETTVLHVRGVATGEPDTDEIDATELRAAALADDEPETGELDGQLDADSDGIVAGTVLPPRLLPGSQIVLASTAADLPEADVPDWLADVSRAVQAWARRRRLGLTSACGIFVALAACSATWFSAGSRADMFRGVAALWIGYLVLAAGRQLAAPLESRLTGGALGAAATGAARGPAAARAAPAARARATALVRSTRLAGWLGALGSSVGEYVVYAGLAAGTLAEHWTGVWQLAIAVLALVSVRNLMSECSTLPGFGAHPQGTIRQISAAVLTMPLGGRILLVGIVAPIWGARAALLALVDWAIVSIGYGIAGRAAERALAGAGTRRSRSGGRVSLLVQLRDDGAIARGLGGLVRGNLLPLPPAVLGLVAVSALGLVGLHDLPILLTLGPVVVMLLVAPGSSHPHDGRLDWLVPPLLLGSQFLYFDAIGHGAGVPGPVIFALTAALALRYTDLASPGRPVLLARPRRPGEIRGERGTGLGWEGRLLIAGLAAAFGVATFAYVALTAYLGLLIVARVLTSSLALGEEDRL